MSKYKLRKGKKRGKELKAACALCVEVNIFWSQQKYLSLILRQEQPVKQSQG